MLKKKVAPLVITLILIFFHSINTFAQKGKMVKLITTVLPVRMIKSSPNHELIAVGDYTNDPLGFNELNEDYTVTVLDINDYSVLHKLKGHTDKIEAINFSFDSKYLVSSDSDGNIFIWDLISGDVVVEINTGDWIHNVKFSNSGQEIIAIQGFEKSALIYDLDGLKISTLNVGVQINDFDFNSKTNQIYLGCHNELQIWSIVSRKKLKSIPLRGLHCLRFNKDYTKFAVGLLSGDIQIFNSANTKIETLEGHFKPVLSISFNFNDNKIVSSSSDQTARVWDLSRGKEILQLTNEHKGSILSVEFLTKDDLFASGGENLELKIWK